MDGEHAKFAIGTGAPSDEEAAAAIASLEALLRESAGAPTPAPRDADRWRATALLEAVQRDASEEEREPWIKA
ncbi:MAG: hypothetical protein ACYCUM_02555 [Solirubrobacteraceae bacterium]